MLGQEAMGNGSISGYGALVKVQTAARAENVKCGPTSILLIQAGGLKVRTMTTNRCGVAALTWQKRTNRLVMHTTSTEQGQRYSGPAIEAMLDVFPSNNQISYVTQMLVVWGFSEGAHDSDL